MLPYLGAPVSTVLLYTTIAAAASALAAVPTALGRAVALPVLAAGYAVATGLMLGLSYLLMEHGIEAAPLPLVLGALLGGLYTAWTHRYTGADDADTLPETAPDPTAGYRLMIAFGLHAASEGVALGAAMVLDLRLGAALALAMALHNVCESLGLARLLAQRGVRAGDIALLSVFANVPQILLAVLAFSVTRELPALFPWLLGFAAGSLVFLTITELLPSAYRRAHRGWIAALVSTAAGGIVLLRALFGCAMP